MIKSTEFKFKEFPISKEDTNRLEKRINILQNQIDRNLENITRQRAHIYRIYDMIETLDKVVLQLKEIIEEKKKWKLKT